MNKNIKGKRKNEKGHSRINRISRMRRVKNIRISRRNIIRRVKQFNVHLPRGQEYDYKEEGEGSGGSDEEVEEEVAACSICHVLFGMVVLEDTRSTAGQKHFIIAKANLDMSL